MKILTGLGLSFYLMLSISAGAGVSFNSIKTTPDISASVKNEGDLSSGLEDSSLKALFISSYSLEWKTVDNQISGLEESLSGAVTLDKEYLDSKNISYTDTRKEEFKDYLVTHRDLSSYDIFIVGDDNALDFCMTYYGEIFNDKPVVFEGVNNINLALKAVDNSNFYGIVERPSYVRNLSFARGFLPNVTQINIISDSSLTGRGEVSQFISEINYDNDFQINDINMSDLTEDEAKDALASLPADQINFMLTFSETKEGKFTKEKMGAILKESVRAPLFFANDIGLDGVFVGGYFYDHRTACLVAGNTVKGILSGTIDESARLNAASYGQYDLDVRLAKEYGFDISKAPEGTILINDSDSFLSKYWIPFIVFMSVGLAIIAVAVIAIILVYKANERNHRLRAAYEELNIAKKKVDILSSTDFLTGLGNPREFHTDIEKLILSGSPFYLIEIDVDNFKSINDLFGHNAGDKVVVKLAEFFKSFNSSKINSYRFGGDEFIFLCSGMDHKEVEDFAEILKKYSSKKISVGLSDLVISFSIGISYSDGSFIKEDEMISNADSAMYYVKQKNKDDYAFFDSKLMKGIKESSYIAQELEEAIAEDKIYMVFQPIIDVRSKKVFGFESLMRVKSLKVGPADFIKVAEHSNLIVRLGRVALEKTLLFMNELKKDGREDAHVFMNFFASQNGDPDFIPAMIKLIDEYQLDSTKFSVEFTESAYFSNVPWLNKLIKDCNKKGIPLTLDDFGSGYSSINNLLNIGYTYVKFDMEMFQRIYKDTFFKNLVNFCHSLNYKIICEGVETPEQLDAVIENGIDYIQGFYFSKPRSKGDAINYLTDFRFPEGVK